MLLMAGMWGAGPTLSFSPSLSPGGHSGLELRSHYSPFLVRSLCVECTLAVSDSQ
jgi:hypothetical protein